MEPTRVWMVALTGPDKGDIEGTLTEDADGLVFAQESSPSTLRVPYADVAKVKRVLGSPVFIVRWGPERHETAFYLTKPPPLGPLHGQDRSPPTSLPTMSSRFRGSGKWRQRRENARYLSTRSSNVRETRDEWVSRIKTAVTERAGGSGG